MFYIREIEENPIYVLENRYYKKTIKSKFTRFMERNAGYFAVAFLLLFMFIIISRSTIPFELVKSLFFIPITLAVLYLSYTALTKSLYLFASEKERRSYQSLISTLLSPQEIFWGKFFCVVYPLIKKFLFIYTFPAFVCTLFGLSIYTVILTPLCVILITSFFTMLGLFISIHKDTVLAARKTGLMLFFILILSGILMSMVGAYYLHYSSAEFLQKETHFFKVWFPPDIEEPSIVYPQGRIPGFRYAISPFLFPIRSCSYFLFSLFNFISISLYVIFMMIFHYDIINKIEVPE